MTQTIQALVVREHGDPGALRLDTTELEAPGPRQVQIDVHAAGVNFPDALLISGEYQSIPPLPFVPGSECSGVVSAVGAEVTLFQPGDRVLALPLGGAFAERAVVPDTQVFHLPASLTFADGAGVLVTTGTVWHALHDRARLQRGESVLVLGAAGGIGIAAIAVAKAAGAIVIAVVSSDQKAQVATEAGADHVIVVSEQPLREQVHAVNGGRGVDVVVDPVGGELFVEAVRALAWRGRALVIGFASGEIPSLKVNRLLLQGIEVIGVYWGRAMEHEPDRFREQVDALLTAMASGQLRSSPVQPVALAEVPQVLQGLLDRERSGKFVAIVRD